MTTASPLDHHPSPVRTRTRGGNSGRATASLVLGILGIVAGAFVPIAGLVLGIVAVVFGGQERRTGAGHAKAGFILGIVAICVSVIAWAVAVAILTS